MMELYRWTFLLAVFLSFNANADAINITDESNSTRGEQIGIEPDIVRNNAKPKEDHVLQGADFILSLRNPDRYGWGAETHRALTALGLAGVLAPQKQRDSTTLLMIKELELRLAVALAKQHQEPKSTGQLALYVNALLAVCDNPRDFYGLNLVSRLAHQSANASSYEYALQSLALCNTGGKYFNKERYLRLVDYIKQDDPEHGMPDTLALTTLALSCGLKTQRMHPSELYLRFAIKKLKKLQRDDGSFGNIYSSALAWQALIGANADDSKWNRTLARDFVLSQQNQNGAFVDYMGTYFSLPPLAGKTFMSLHNWTCSDNTSLLDGQDILDEVHEENGTLPISINVFIRAPEIESYKVSLTGQSGSNLYTVLKKNQEFITIEWKDTSFGHMIVGVDGLYEDTVQKKYWTIYIKKNGTETFATTGVDGIFPKNEDDYIFQLTKFN